MAANEYRSPHYCSKMRNYWLANTALGPVNLSQDLTEAQVENFIRLADEAMAKSHPPLKPHHRMVIVFSHDWQRLLGSIIGEQGKGLPYKRDVCAMPELVRGTNNVWYVRLLDETEKRKLHAKRR